MVALTLLVWHQAQLASDRQSSSQMSMTSIPLWYDIELQGILWQHVAGTMNETPIRQKGTREASLLV